MLDRSLVGFRSILVEWQLKTNFRCHIIWVGPLYPSFLIRGQSAAIRGLDRGGAEGNPRGAAGAEGNPRNPPALQIREARMKRLVNTVQSSPQLSFSVLLGPFELVKRTRHIAYGSVVSVSATSCASCHTTISSVKLFCALLQQTSSQSTSACVSDKVHGQRVIDDIQAC